MVGVDDEVLLEALLSLKFRLRPGKEVKLFVNSSYDWFVVGPEVSCCCCDSFIGVDTRDEIFGCC